VLSERVVSDVRNGKLLQNTNDNLAPEVGLKVMQKIRLDIWGAPFPVNVVAQPAKVMAYSMAATAGRSVPILRCAFTVLPMSRHIAVESSTLIHDNS
jgi:hypothetical protein